MDHPDTRLYRLDRLESPYLLEDGLRVDDGLEEEEEVNLEEVPLEHLEKNTVDQLVVGGRAHFHLGVSEKHCG